jgi:hypothetical protein
MDDPPGRPDRSSWRTERSAARRQSPETGLLRGPPPRHDEPRLRRAGRHEGVQAQPQACGHTFLRPRPRVRMGKLRQPREGPAAMAERARPGPRAAGVRR